MDFRPDSTEEASSSEAAAAVESNIDTVEFLQGKGDPLPEQLKLSLLFVITVFRLLSILWYTENKHLN